MKHGIVIAIILSVVAITFTVSYCLATYIVSDKNSGYVLEFGNPSICNCAMVVAHPDDETIFGGRTLLYSPPDHLWHIVVMTNASNKKRVQELQRAMSHFKQVKAITVFDAKDRTARVMKARLPHVRMWVC